MARLKAGIFPRGILVTGLAAYLAIPLEVVSGSFAKSCNVELIKGLKAEVISPSMSFNGAGQKIVKIESLASRQEVVKNYLSRWRSTHSEPLDARIVSSGNWEIVSKITGNCLHTAQLDKRSYSASGYVSVRDIDSVGNLQSVDLGKGFPKLYGSRVLSDISFDDPGKKARTVMIVNNFSIDANADFYLRNLGGEGWGVLSDHRIPIQRRDEMARVITFGKRHEKNIVVISENRLGSNVVLQWMEKP